MSQHDPDGFLIAQAQTTQTVLTNQVPSLSDATDDGTSYELGMKFRSNKAGQITAIRHWKAASETGTHVGRIWSSTGSILATITFSNETAFGWQQQALSSPLNIQANTIYVVTVNINSHFPITHNGLTSPVVNGDLSSVAGGNNGVFGNPGAFPTNSYLSSNYFRDVVFVAGGPPTITKVSGDDQSGTAGTALPSPLVVQVKDGAGYSLAGITVSFAVTSGSGGSVSPTSAVTDANGQASTVLTLGPTAGTTSTVSAAASGVGTISFSARANPATTNPISLENQQPGTTAWKITNQGTTEIVGYAVATSVNRGGSLPLKVSLAQAGTYTIDVYRLGYYGGKGGRLMVSSGSLSGTTQPAGTFDSTTRLVQCNWSTSYTVQVGANWTSGMYIAKLTDQGTGKQSQIWFVVRDNSSTSNVLFQCSFTTFLAYNNTGGYSLYGWNSIGGQRAAKVSFDRPFAQTSTQTTQYDQYTLWERNMMRWMESQGYDISYVTNMDVHNNPQLLRQHKVFLSVGHDEYWSMDERDGVEQARDAGVNLGFFSANTAYWRVRFENGTGDSNRVMACYKDATDPVVSTNKFRLINRPENALLGVMYTGDRWELYDTWTNPSNPTYGGFDLVVANSADSYYANTNLQNGDTLYGLVGFEWDAVVNNGATPNGLVILAQAGVNPSTIDEHLPPGTNTQISHVVRYTAASGAKVFSTGSIQWMWGLDSDRISPNHEDRRVKQIAVNVLASMGAKPLTPDSNLIVP